MRLRAVWLKNLSLLWNETMLLGDVDTVGQKRFFRKYARSNEFVSRNLKPFGPLWNASEGAACDGVGFRSPFTYNSVRQFLIQCTRRITINKIGRSKFTFVAWSNKNDLWKTVSLVFEFWQILWHSSWHSSWQSGNFNRQTAKITSESEHVGIRQPFLLRSFYPTL